MNNQYYFNNNSLPCILFLSMLLFSFVSCEQPKTVSKQEAVQVIEKDFGLHSTDNDSMSVELQLDTFENFDALIQRTEVIVCHDSLPRLTFQDSTHIKRIYFRNPCLTNVGCILIKQKNIIIIHNDTINKQDENFYPLDSLQTVLQRDLENNGKNPDLCDSPEKLLIYISYDENGLKKLPNTLKKLIQAYEAITDDTDLKVWLYERIEIPPPPPIPKEPEEIELIEDGD